ncbi:MAG TPA: FAD-dependent oxidoreductase, partial [Solirubrobacteraceae bacterium]|nr:FAD-dependent oxidoreductase [Solirubrobacteraceae bacterium]
CMASTTPSPDAAHVLIAGGGFAAVETMLALRALAPERVRMTLISASPVLAYKPTATTEAFDETPPRTYDLQAIAADAGASFHLDRLEAVASHDHSVRLKSFAFLDYDALVLAVGARPTRSIPGALTFRDQREVNHIRRLTSELRAGKLHRIIFAVPHGCSWPLPLYELALLTATHLEEQGAEGEVVLVSPEIAPLQVFGAEASLLVADLLAERGVRFIGESDPQSVEHDGALLLGSGGSLDADCVVAVPELRGPRITGVPTDREGFITTDALGGVTGLSDVYAAGDMTSFPIKQGGLAAQQADLIAQRIASENGAAVKELRVQHVLRARLIGGAHPVFLRAELDERGQATAATLQHQHSEPTDSPSSPEKVFGRYLTPYLQTREPVLAHSLTDG